METRDILHELRTKKGLSQDELAEKLFVTRQAVSRWENGDTTPNVETLKLLSGLFDVSINTLLGSPRQLICQCCGMPLDDTTTSREPDGSSIMRGRSVMVCGVSLFAGISFGRMRLISGSLFCHCLTRRSRYSFSSHGWLRNGKHSAENQRFGSRRPSRKPNIPVAAR